MKRTCFVAAGPMSWGSSRMRAYWPADGIEGATVVQYGEVLPEADVYVWQKLVDPDQIAQRDFCTHIWDVCDPAWWFEPAGVANLLPMIDHVTASNKGLADDLADFMRSALPDHADRPAVTVIPDRLNFSHFGNRRMHYDGDVTRLIWYGVAVNRIALYAAMANLQRLVANGHSIQITIFDDRPDIRVPDLDRICPVAHVQWQLRHEVAVLSAHDLALLPPYPGPWGRVKSNNRMITAYAAGLPVTDGQHYPSMQQLVRSAELRQRLADDAQLLLPEYAVSMSAVQWQGLIDRLAK